MQYSRTTLQCNNVTMVVFSLIPLFYVFIYRTPVTSRPFSWKATGQGLLYHRHHLRLHPFETTTKVNVPGRRTGRASSWVLQPRSRPKSFVRPDQTQEPWLYTYNCQNFSLKRTQYTRSNIRVKRANLHPDLDVSLPGRQAILSLTRHKTYNFKSQLFMSALMSLTDLLLSYKI